MVKSKKDAQTATLCNTVLGEVLSLDEITKTKQVKMNKNNYWLLNLVYGDAAYDRTARFQLPHNVICRTLKR